MEDKLEQDGENEEGLNQSKTAKHALFPTVKSLTLLPFAHHKVDLCHISTTLTHI